MMMEKYREYADKAIHCGLPYAMWSLPGETKVDYIFCHPEELIKTYSLSQLDKHKGFIFSPFQICKHLPIYIIPSGSKVNLENFQCKKKREPIISSVKQSAFDLELAKKEHIRQVNFFLKEFETTKIRKAVLSRSKWLPAYSIKQMPQLFEALNQTYINAFVYQIFIPNVGYWVGATPELLFSTNNGSATTVSLAGTQPQKPNDEVTWDHKERVEQELVTEHIRNVLKMFRIAPVSEIGPETTIAGNVVHLKTILQFSKENIQNRIGQFIENLHPTPAVCGLPVKDSLELILETEGYDREYYTGFLGPFDPSNKMNLFVNLRCLQAFDDGVLLYAGGGITAESEPEKEWEETRIKIQTLERILEQLSI
ncbi:MAG TPA: hypothetical protein DCQ26_00450 [Marinilabiliales bacterium]|nr:MAG: hypothetical protein A2W95_08320 [Bacteroidetes bacterium GWA2_40_14]OFX63760.1 MAG: hypothetical protein A2W84_16985 [Bacteroidetes bacterium GWC2_40_13]OFX75204.1 MAG: hypothetical protein A2W96_16530 [Bacteroidetes bacterium GWD2_40_43]OFX89801.1 MAG: hypothetical protein A2W97_12190 [Bacteroidetes bacterium GWE2_40_63]OFY22006.1 MAG: hypothetical protein A2W88_00655 [Bacteroidetes bacterium GWF2_40_13]OFZ26099.1 MAG: hypothetical protein A2437_10515 [Bacteroidetes bacterium RIFOXYC